MSCGASSGSIGKWRRDSTDAFTVLPGDGVRHSLPSRSITLGPSFAQPGKPSPSPARFPTPAKALGIYPSTRAWWNSSQAPAAGELRATTRRRRRNRPPETLRQNGPRRAGISGKPGRAEASGPHRRRKGLAPNLSGTVTEGGHLHRHSAGGWPYRGDCLVAHSRPNRSAAY
jgi:hypothetical protein